MDIYIAQTYYHLFISLVKGLLSNTESSLLLFKEAPNNTMIDDNRLIEMIKKYKIFKDVYIIDYSKKIYSPNEKVKKIKRLFNVFARKKKINKILKNYDNIYLFNDLTTIGKIVNYLNYDYILLEDGQDCFKNNKKLIENEQKNKIISLIEKKFFHGSNRLGNSNKIKYIEVNDANGVTINNQTIIEVNKNDLYKKLSKKDIEILLDIFGVLKVLKRYHGNYSILITQPLSQDGLLSSNEEQEKMYECIINKYLNKENIIIKTHPRESLDYKSLNNTSVIREKFPLELMNYYNDIKINKVITISSTSIDTFCDCKEKIILGWDWLERYKKGDIR